MIQRGLELHVKSAYLKKNSHPIQNHWSARFVHLQTMYFDALLYSVIKLTINFSNILKNLWWLIWGENTIKGLNNFFRFPDVRSCLTIKCVTQSISCKCWEKIVTTTIMVKILFAQSIIFKGQLISEWLIDVLNLPKNQYKNLTNFCHRI